MPPEISEEVADFFAQASKERKVVADPNIFKLKIGKVGFPYQKLETAKDVTRLAGTLFGGVGISGTAFLGWAGSLSVVGKAGLLLGLLTTPWGWIAMAGLAGAAATWATTQAFKKIDQNAYSRIPNFINSPIDLLGDQVYGIITAATFCTLGSQHFQSEPVKTSLLDYFSEQWGLDKNYLVRTYPIVAEGKDLPNNVADIHMRISRLDSKDVDSQLFLKEIVFAIERIVRLAQIQDESVRHRMDLLA
jgi:hypothetical protein